MRTTAALLALVAVGCSRQVESKELVADAGGDRVAQLLPPSGPCEGGEGIAVVAFPNHSRGQVRSRWTLIAGPQGTLTDGAEQTASLTACTSGLYLVKLEVWGDESEDRASTLVNVSVLPGYSGPDGGVADGAPGDGGQDDGGPAADGGPGDGGPGDGGPDAGKADGGPPPLAPIWTLASAPVQSDPAHASAIPGDAVEAALDPAPGVTSCTYSILPPSGAQIYPHQDNGNGRCRALVIPLAPGDYTVGLQASGASGPIPANDLQLHVGAFTKVGAAPGGVTFQGGAAALSNGRGFAGSNHKAYLADPTGGLQEISCLPNNAVTSLAISEPHDDLVVTLQGDSLVRFFKASQAAASASCSQSDMSDVPSGATFQSMATVTPNFIVLGNDAGYAREDFGGNQVLGTARLAPRAIATDPAWLVQGVFTAISDSICYRPDVDLPNWPTGTGWCTTVQPSSDDNNHVLSFGGSRLWVGNDFGLFVFEIRDPAHPEKDTCADSGCPGALNPVANLVSRVLHAEPAQDATVGKAPLPYGGDVYFTRGTGSLSKIIGPRAKYTFPQKYLVVDLNVASAYTGDVVGIALVPNAQKRQLWVVYSNGMALLQP